MVRFLANNSEIITPLTTNLGQNLDRMARHLQRGRNVYVWHECFFKYLIFKGPIIRCATDTN